MQGGALASNEVVFRALEDIACMHCGLSVIYLVWPEHHPFSELPNQRFTYITGVEFLHGGRERQGTIRAMD